LDILSVFCGGGGGAEDFGVALKILIVFFREERNQNCKAT